MISLTIIFISSIIIETVLLKIFIKKKWYESFKLCTIANLLSILAWVIFAHIVAFVFKKFMPFSELIVAIIHVFSWLGVLVIPIWIENVIYQRYWKDIPKRKLLKAVIIVNIITYMLLGVFFYCMPEIMNKDKAMARHFSCQSHLRKIGRSLQQYAEENKGFFPNEGLEQLRIGGYLTKYGVYVCPVINNKRGKDKQKLTEENVDYIYRKGLKYNYNKNSAYSKIPIVWDKPSNHNDYGNVVFANGQFKGFEGKDWMEQAGIKKTATQQGKRFNGSHNIKHKKQ